MAMLLLALAVATISCDEERRAPVCHILIEADGTALTAGRSVIIRVDGSDPEGSPLKGCLLLDGQLVRSAEFLPLVFTWEIDLADTGTHLAEARVLDGDGLEGHAKMQLHVLPDPGGANGPKSAFNAHHNHMLTGSPVFFFDISKYGPVSRTWDFGDGQGSKERNPVHTYHQAGSYSVSLVVSNALGADTLLRHSYITVVDASDSLVHDHDGNVYSQVTIGEQTWLKENMKATHYTSGDPVQDGTDAGILDYDTISRYYFSYENQDSNISAYGRLYTWQAAMAGNPSSNANPSGVQGICPEGWHVPSDAEWMQLELFLGMSQEDIVKNKARGDNEGGMLKEKGTAHWLDPNQGATDDHGFSAMPAGERFWSGIYYDKGKRGSYWSSTKFQHNAAWQRWFYHEHGMICRFDFNRISVGSSVRCIKD